MDWLADLADASVIVFAFLLFLIQIIAHDMGTWFGRRTAARGKPDVANVNLVVTSMLGLLGFVLALTLSFSSTRFQERQAATLREANSIGTAWLRTMTIDDPRALEIAKMLEEYGKVRKAFVQAPRSGDSLKGIDERTAELQTRIWKRIESIARERQDPVVVALIAAVNETFDAGSATRFAIDVRPPSQGIWLLFGLALLSIGTLGYQMGLRGRTYRVISALLIAMWTMVIFVILDLGSSRLGNIRSSGAAYDWMLQTFNGQSSMSSIPTKHK